MKTIGGLIRLGGDVAVDDRGCLRFVNEFNFRRVKRFYQVENHNTGIIRAWHGHKKEGKYVYVARGVAIVAAVRINNWVNPDKKTVVERLVLSAAKPQVVYIPPGYANGFRALEKETVVIFYSTSTLEQSKGDDYRFAYDYWGKDIWQVENR